MHDVVVVGGGVVGLAVAREVLRRRPATDLLLVEKEDVLAAHQTAHNSGVLHAGLYYAPGSVRAALTARGRPLMEDYCDAHGIPRVRNGKLVVLVDDAERARFDALWRRVRANRVPGARLLGPDEARRIEPHVAARAAIHSPATGVTDFAAVARALAADVRNAGGRVTTGRRVVGIVEHAGHVEVACGDAHVATRLVVACAGLQSDRLAARARDATGAATGPARRRGAGRPDGDHSPAAPAPPGQDLPVGPTSPADTLPGAPRGARVVPFRGSWLELVGEAAGLVRGNVYPVPDPALPFLGVHATRGIDGRVLAGPNAVLAGARERYDRRWAVDARDLRDSLGHPGLWRLARRHWRAGVEELARDLSLHRAVADLRRYLPDVTVDDVRRGPFGIRAQVVTRAGDLLDDFAVDRTPRVLHVRNAPSPAATAALAIADVLAALVVPRLP